MITGQRCVECNCVTVNNVTVCYRSLSNELHALFRVMWSGKWAIVSPHSLLHAVWNVIPFFKGYTQQDAQEFMWWVALPGGGGINLFLNYALHRYLSLSPSVKFFCSFYKKKSNIHAAYF